MSQETKYRPQSSVGAVSLRRSSGRSTRSSRVAPRTTPRTPAGICEAASAPAFRCRAIAPLLAAPWTTTRTTCRPSRPCGSNPREAPRHIEGTISVPNRARSRRRTSAVLSVRVRVDHPRGLHLYCPALSHEATGAVARLLCAVKSAAVAAAANEAGLGMAWVASVSEPDVTAGPRFSARWPTDRAD
jgi:hypothetical protein